MKIFTNTIHINNSNIVLVNTNEAIALMLELGNNTYSRPHQGVKPVKLNFEKLMDTKIKDIRAFIEANEVIIIEGDIENINELERIGF